MGLPDLPALVVVDRGSAVTPVRLLLVFWLVVYVLLEWALGLA